MLPTPYVGGNQMGNWKAVVAAALLCVSVPAMADEYLAVTPSGMAEMMFPDRPTGAIGKLTSKCIDSRWTVISSTATELVCEAPMNFGQSLLGTMLMGNAYSTPPRRFFRFNVAEINGVSRIQASGWMELQMAFGQMKRTDFAGPDFQNSIMNFMGAAGGKLPVGTTFPNHAVLGIEVEDAPMGKAVGLRIKTVDSDGPAAKAGLQVADVVTHIAGKQFKNMNDYLDATAKAAKTDTYEVRFLRAGTSMKAMAARAYRPAITESVVAAPQEPAMPATAPIAQTSVADELAKLAKLKDQGLLSDAEFQAQKKKLLGL